MSAPPQRYLRPLLLTLRLPPLRLPPLRLPPLRLPPLRSPPLRSLMLRSPMLRSLPLCGDLHRLVSQEPYVVPDHHVGDQMAVVHQRASEVSAAVEIDRVHGAYASIPFG